MNIIIRTLAGTAIIGAAALGLAGTATAAATGGQSPTGPGNLFSPGTYATPAPIVGPGWYNNHGPAYIAHLNGY